MDQGSAERMGRAGGFADQSAAAAHAPMADPPAPQRSRQCSASRRLPHRQRESAIAAAPARSRCSQQSLLRPHGLRYTLPAGSPSLGSACDHLGSSEVWYRSCCSPQSPYTAGRLPPFATAIPSRDTSHKLSRKSAVRPSWVIDQPTTRLGMLGSINPFSKRRTWFHSSDGTTDAALKQIPSMVWRPRSRPLTARLAPASQGAVGRPECNRA